MREEKFTFSKITSPDLLKEVFHLRFQVYCCERQFLKESDYPQAYETDDLDAHSLHFGSFNNEGRLVGAVRMILPSCKKFPIEERCSDLSPDILLPPRQECMEISRLTISKFYCRRTKEDDFERGSQEAQNSGFFIRQVSPITLGLCWLLYHECRRTGLGINYCFALMEKPLWLLLRLCGFVFDPIGEEIDYYGVVRPYLLDIPEFERKGTGLQKSDRFFYSNPVSRIPLEAELL